MVPLILCAPLQDWVARPGSLVWPISDVSMERHPAVRSRARRRLSSRLDPFEDYASRFDLLSLLSTICAFGAFQQSIQPHHPLEPADSSSSVERTLVSKSASSSPSRTRISEMIDSSSGEIVSVRVPAEVGATPAPGRSPSAI